VVLSVLARLVNILLEREFGCCQSPSAPPAVKARLWLYRTAFLLMPTVLMFASAALKGSEHIYETEVVAGGPVYQGYTSV